MAAEGAGRPGGAPGLRIGDAAARFSVSTRTLRYYEELGLLTPSGHTAGGERRYAESDLQQLGRIVELRDVLGMNLDEIKRFLDVERHLDDVREAYRAKKGVETATARAQRRALLEEILRLNESLAEQVGEKLERMTAFRETLLASVQRCHDLIAELS